jgi:AcrR family transcriptional regulator
MGRRVSKDPEVRRQELVVAAYELFREKGFEQVSVSDIVKKVGLAQGTFYYHFKTKYELLDAVVDYDMRKNLAALETIIDDEKLPPLEKMQAVISLSLNLDEIEKSFIGLVRSEANAVTYQKYAAKMSELLVPHLTKVVENGVAAGVFEVQYPRETMEMLFNMHLALQHSLATTKDRDACYRKLRAAEDVYVKVMGVKRGSIRLIS